MPAWKGRIESAAQGKIKSMRRIIINRILLACNPTFYMDRYYRVQLKTVILEHILSVLFKNLRGTLPIDFANM